MPTILAAQAQAHQHGQEVLFLLSVRFRSCHNYGVLRSAFCVLRSAFCVLLLFCCCSAVVVVQEFPPACDC